MTATVWMQLAGLGQPKVECASTLPETCTCWPLHQLLVKLDADHRRDKQQTVAILTESVQSSMPCVESINLECQCLALWISVTLMIIEISDNR